MADSKELLFQQSQRLDRFEDQLGEVSKAIVQIAKTEERVSVLIEQNSLLFKKMDVFQKAVNEIKIESATQKQSLGFFERIGWIITSAFIGGLAWLSGGVG